MTKLHGIGLFSLGVLLLAAELGAGSSVARAEACTIPQSPCYPWLIREDESEAVLLEIIPNNVETGAIYRVCVCPPATDVAIVFDFRENERTLGTISGRGDGPVCRDYRFQTARQSSLKVRRISGSKSVIEGCYLTTY
jgi:hypothetical protein